MNNAIKIYLSQYDVTILSIDSTRSGRVNCFVIKGKRAPDMIGIHNYLSIDESFIRIFNFTIDERLYNNIELSEKDLDAITDNMSRDEWKFIKSKFQEFKG